MTLFKLLQNSNASPEGPVHYTYLLFTVSEDWKLVVHSVRTVGASCLERLQFNNIINRITSPSRVQFIPTHVTYTASYDCSKSIMRGRAIDELCFASLSSPFLLHDTV